MKVKEKSSERIRITVGNSIKELEAVSHAVRAFGGENELTSDTTFALDLSLEELLTNIIKYGYDDRACHEIEVCIDIRPGFITVEVQDDGHAFNPVDEPDPDIHARTEDRPIGGLGLHLIKKLADSIEYRRSEGMNIVRIVFRRDLYGEQIPSPPSHE
jgi:anti-sigma regulatory factor (Ser/Thr protein kinase)